MKKNQNTSPDSVLFIQLLSVIYEPIGITKLLLCVKGFGIKQDDGKQHDPKTLKLLINTLIKKNLVQEKDKLYFCPQETVEETSRQALQTANFEKMASIVQDVLPISQHWYTRKASSWKQAVRELRIAIYLDKEKQALLAIGECETYFDEYHYENPLLEMFFKPFDPEYFSRLPKGISAIAISAAFQHSAALKHCISELFEWLIDALKNQNYQLNSSIIHGISKILILQGNFSQAKTLLENANDYHRSMLQGWILFAENKNDAAIECFDHSHTTLKKLTKKRKIFIDNLSGAFYLLALFQRGTASDIQKITEYTNIAIKSQEHSTHLYQMFAYLIDFINGQTQPDFLFENLPEWPANISAFDYFMQTMILHWIDKKIASTHQRSLKQHINEIEATGYRWLIAESCELLSRLGKKEAEKYSKRAKEIRESCGFETIIDTIKTKEPWERALDAMSHFTSGQKSETSKKKSRLIWILDLSESKLLGASVKEQKQNAKGTWSSGRQVGLKRLSEDTDSFDCLSKSDLRASNAVVYYRDYWGGNHQFDSELLLPALVGHPLLFLADKNNTSIELVKGTPEIQVIKKGNYLTIKMVPTFDPEENIALVKETATQWKLIESSVEQKHLASLIGDSLKIPLAAKDKVLSSMSAIAPFVDIHSDIGGGITDAEEVKTDNTLHLLLSPLDEGLKIEARTQVFGSKGPYYRPGAGGKTIIAEVEGKRLQTTRDLKIEKKNLQTVMTQCPELNNIEMSNDEWAIFEPETCLEVLLELKAQKDIIVSWPEGEKLKVNQTIGLSDFKMVIKKENDWFAASGEIKLDDGQVLNMKRLMDLTRSAKGRFISLADGQFIALTDTFKNRMTELQAFGEEQGDKITLHPLAALALDDMANDVGKLKSDKNWKSYISRFHEAMDLEPEVPSTLQAELRDYQKEGYQWLVRLAHWGVGACLADDMGLGKTVQTIALLLHRASHGAALIVAPTSVAMNWMDEIERFAPTLNIIDYRESKRSKVLKDIGPFDIVICSYGLIQNNIKQIEAVKWTTVVLDEAQAIKNSATKRSQAIMRINAEVKIILTGTPIENHLGELWNLFRFINPGLLGSMESFNSRYANPIVKDESIDSRQKLKKLIHPYILRRTKTQVLKELPPRTEIALQVEMSKDEATLYEALRREAVDKFTDADIPQGHRQLQILAEITRLRRVCCNPALVLKAGAPASSKLALFVNVVQELLENNHKALVFSQFVDHLTILKEKLDELGVKYQYLDGSTPVKMRKKRVAEFQAGVGDIFLISLKAGGVGLNLTAADYVIHMDPWWNPAVEDQASDRAHRIGQKRPVTVYRMITKNTIEEKIVALHKGKRDLADNLLAGSEVATKVNVEELLSLLKED